ncbi:C-type lectin domain family 1 member A-like [Anas platyrhynchos]|uniref:C-type lectin domain family 1 member A-like n=1 Tax=Anas platyrhynchos TaxID=8839 RepID=UPI0018D5F5B3|nr:C-type lectin domain family 1 member A-like [Anas platyrhynchos]
MTEEVTYADLKFVTLEKLQTKDIQTARAKGSRSRSSCWQLAAMVIGVICLSSVVATGVLAAKFILVCHTVHERDENFTLQKAIMENLSQQLEHLQAQNLNLSETIKQLATSRGYKCTPCPETWLQYGENCYYFSKEWKTWQESKARCSALESRFLKIESKKELDFVMQSAQSYGSYSFWTGLSHNGSEGPWLWEDGSAFSTDLFQFQETSSRPFLECVWLQGSNIGTAQCGEYKFCICEKMVDPAVIEQVNYSDRQ